MENEQHTNRVQKWRENMHAHIWRKNQNKCIKETIKIVIANYLINSLPQIIKKVLKNN